MKKQSSPDREHLGTTDITGDSLTRNRADTTSTAADHDEDHEKIWNMMKSCRFALLTTVGRDGTLRSRPMTTVQKEFGGTLWFFAPRDSEAARDLEGDDHVCVSYANTDKADFVCLSGNGSIVTHDVIKEKLWNPMVQAWFPQGPRSPDVVLIKADINHAEYWDSNNKVTQLLSMASAYLKGTTPKEAGEHRELRM